MTLACCKVLGMDVHLVLHVCECERVVGTWQHGVRCVLAIAYTFSRFAHHVALLLDFSFSTLQHTKVHLATSNSSWRKVMMLSAAQTKKEAARRSPRRRPPAPTALKPKYPQP